MNIDNFRMIDDPAPCPEEWMWERIRVWRNAELNATDWTQLPDSPVDSDAWATYRQELRDLTKVNAPEDVIFPARP